MNWDPKSWRGKKVSQAPDYQDAGPDAGHDSGHDLLDTEARLRAYPSLVSQAEIHDLHLRLAAAARGEAFVLQAGDCAETFVDLNLETIRNNFKVFLQMALVLTFGLRKPVVKIGRVAGQFAKPRSDAFETRDGVRLPSYRGDMINGFEFTPESRRHRPQRMEQAYYHAGATLNSLRALAQGGFADLQKIHQWNLEFSQSDDRYAGVVSKMSEMVELIKAMGLLPPQGAQLKSHNLQTVDFFSSHEALLLPYEEALLRRGENLQVDEFFAGSGHFLWIGDRTRDLDGAHVEFARGIINPIGLKCGPQLSGDDLLRLIDRLNPRNDPGRLTLITRMGSQKIPDLLPPMVRQIQREGRNVLWSCDPMHGNSKTDRSGRKTRLFDDILRETKTFMEIHRAEGTIAGGVHLELTGKNVSECLDSGRDISSDGDLNRSYETFCDPRLNASQALQIAFGLITGA